MNRLIRRSYGRSGSRFDRVLVTAPPSGVEEESGWGRLVQGAILLSVPVLVCSLSLAPKRETTVIDTTKIVIPPITVAKVKPLPERIPPMKAIEEKAPPPVPATGEQRPIPAPEPEPARIDRAPRAAETAAVQESPARIARTRNIPQASAPQEPAAAPVRRGSGGGPAAEPAYQVASLSRVRQGVALEPSGEEGKSVTRTRGSSTAASEGPVGDAPQVARFSRGSRSYESGGSVGSSVAVSRGRGGSSTSTGEGEASSAGVVRGISLASLDICSSSQEEEKEIREVLQLVDSRQSCRSDKGEFHFRSAGRISSFNLVIYPAKGRKPSNRCEELEHAQRCLKAG